MKQVQYYGPTNCRCYSTKIRYPDYLMTGIFVLLV